MELKEYQKKTLDQVKLYLEALVEFKAKNGRLVKKDPELSINFPLKAWEKVVSKTYYSKKNGLGEDLPNFYLKIPTGGGKTLLACHVIDLVNRTYLKKQTGIVLLIVPSTQIYHQTLVNLKNWGYPYCQVLDISSGEKLLSWRRPIGLHIWIRLLAKWLKSPLEILTSRSLWNYQLLHLKTVISLIIINLVSRKMGI